MNLRKRRKKVKTLEDKNGTIILRCNCDSKVQDKLYGLGMRVFNLKAKKDSGKAHCTVCGRKA